MSFPYDYSKLLLFTAILTVFCRQVKLNQEEFLQKAYTEYSLVSIELRDVGHVQLINNLEGKHGIQLDFWKRVEGGLNESLAHAEVLVAPADKPRLTALLHEHRLHHHIKIDDVEELIRAERLETSKRKIFTSADDPSNMTLDEYHTYEEIKQYLLAVSKKYSDFVTYWTIGKSSEGRDLAALKIGYANNTQQKKAAFIDGVFMPESGLLVLLWCILLAS
uniref:Peptidase M14 domain-containing protein n=1 Tax=Ditylenchus dipsaci TaxID=166011 RepID=A0A915EMP8_9BILA